MQWRGLRDWGVRSGNEGRELELQRRWKGALVESGGRREARQGRLREVAASFNGDGRGRESRSGCRLWEEGGERDERVLERETKVWVREMKELGSQKIGRYRIFFNHPRSTD